MKSNLFQDVKSEYLNEKKQQEVGEFDELIRKYAKQGKVVVIHDKGTKYGATYDRCKRNKKYYEGQGFHVRYETTKALVILALEPFYYHKLTIYWN